MQIVINIHKMFWCAVFVLLACSGLACGADEEITSGVAREGTNWLPVVYVVGGSAVGGSGMWLFNKLHRVRIEPQPLEVQLKQEFVTRAEFKSLTDRVDSITSSLAELKGSQTYQTNLLQSINAHLIHKAL